MKIGFIGLGNMGGPMAANLARAGHAVTIVGPDHPDLPRGEGWDGVAYRPLPLLDRSGRLWKDVLRDFSWSRRAKRLLPEADVTVTNCVWLPWLLGRRGSAARRGLGLLEVHVQRFPKGQMGLYRHADSISTVSQAIADAIVRERPHLADRVRVVPNPVDLAVFHPSPEAQARRLGEPRILLYTGRIHPEKRLDLLVGAWRRLVEEGVPLRLRLVGPWERGAGGGGRELVEQLRSLAGPHEFEMPGPLADPSALDNSIGAMIFVRDQPGSDPQGELAHGSGFDRVRAFQDGFEGGIEYCFGYLEDPPFIDELPFTEQDAANQGNLPFADVTDLVVEDLEDYFSANVDGFEGPGDPFDTVPADELDALHAEVGDGAVATVFGMLWAERAQAAAGDDLDGEGPLLQRSCLVGSWLGDILRDQRDGQVDRESGVSLSPGDLDETIITFLKLTEDAMAGSGVAFEAIADMRLGVFGGIEDCRLGE